MMLSISAAIFSYVTSNLAAAFAARRFLLCSPMKNMHSKRKLNIGNLEFFVLGWTGIRLLS
jgi:hypothetical protein